MKAAAALVALATIVGSAGAQPGDRDAIVYGARAVGETTWHFGRFSLFSPDTAPQTFEVGVFFFRKSGVGFAGAVYKTYIDGVVNDGSDGVQMIDDPANGVSVGDGRQSVYNSGPQTQGVFSNRGADLNGSGLRISGAADTADAGAPGGISVKQAGPVGNADFHTADGELGFRFNLTVSSLTAGTRHFQVGTPFSRLSSFAVYYPDGRYTPIIFQNATFPIDGIDLRASWVTCPSDVNGDGFVDGIDYDQFNNAFEGGDAGADYNADGFVDGIDYDEFMIDFEAGC